MKMNQELPTKLLKSAVTATATNATNAKRLPPSTVVQPSPITPTASVKKSDCEDHATQISTGELSNKVVPGIKSKSICPTTAQALGQSVTVTCCGSLLQVIPMQLNAVSGNAVSSGILPPVAIIAVPNKSAATVAVLPTSEDAERSTLIQGQGQGQFPNVSATTPQAAALPIMSNEKRKQIVDGLSKVLPSAPTAKKSLCNQVAITSSQQQQKPHEKTILTREITSSTILQPTIDKNASHTSGPLKRSSTNVDTSRNVRMKSSSSGEMEKTAKMSSVSLDCAKNEIATKTPTSDLPSKPFSSFLLGNDVILVKQSLNALKGRPLMGQEKQESLLKTNIKDHLSISVRSKRSQSLTTASQNNNNGHHSPSERRHSMPFNDGSPSAQNVNTRKEIEENLAESAKNEMGADDVLPEIKDEGSQDLIEIYEESSDTQSSDKSEKDVKSEDDQKQKDENTCENAEEAGDSNGIEYLECPEDKSDQANSSESELGEDVILIDEKREEILVDDDDDDDDDNDDDSHSADGAKSKSTGTGYEDNKKPEIVIEPIKSTISSITSSPQKELTNVEQQKSPVDDVEEKVDTTIIRLDPHVTGSEVSPLSKVDDQSSEKQSTCPPIDDKSGPTQPNCCDEKLQDQLPTLKTEKSAADTATAGQDDENIKDPQPVRLFKNKSKTVGGNLSDSSSYSTMLDMLSTFSMLTWKERIGTARGTNLRFQLNEFKLLQIHERCPPRHRIQTAYERPIYERESMVQTCSETNPLLYLCRRCNCHGPASDFIAPEFCSVECLRRDARKRQRKSMKRRLRAKRPRRERREPTSETSSSHAQIVKSEDKKSFLWCTYLTGKNSTLAAPIDLFLNPFPTGPNGFQIGMKVEAIDPDNCSLFCVCSVVAIQGYRLKLSFDGYENVYDFWVNADSMDIFPPGWCLKTNRILQPPKGLDPCKFNWPSYLARSRAVPAPRYLFTHLNSSSGSVRNPFKVGMHLEAEDLNDTGKLCVATVADVLDSRIRIHFDGWDDCYDYWVDIGSPYIHPCGYHEGRQQLIVPPDLIHIPFSWSEYIRQIGSGEAALDELFATRDPIDFKPNMKLEVVDPRNPSLIRPASIVGRKGHRVKVHLEFWPPNYCFWLEDDSPDLHPIGWCDATGHDLEPPPGFQMPPVKALCGTEGCRGIGNAKDFVSDTHGKRDCCPYASDNWRLKMDKPIRVKTEDIYLLSNVEKKCDLALTNDNLQNQPTELEPCIGNERAQIIKQENENIECQRRRTRSKSNTLCNASLLIPKLEKDNKIEVTIKSRRVSSQNLTHRPKMVTNKKAKTQKALRFADGEDDENIIKVSKEFLCDYGPRLLQSYNILNRNLALDVNTISKNPQTWSIAETCSFVENVCKSSEIASLFASEEIDGASFLDLQQSDISDMLGLKFGTSVKLYAYILKLRVLVISRFKTV